MNTDIAAQHALDRLYKLGFDALTETDKTLAAAWLIDASVENDGFAHFYSSKRGNLAFHAPAALRRIGATRLAEIAVEANAVFGSAGPPRDREARRAIVRGLDETTRRKFDSLDERFCDCPEDIDELFEVFLNPIETAQTKEKH